MSRGGGYDYYIISYEYMNKSYSQEIHNSFSIKKWKKDERIKIKVNKNAPDKNEIITLLLRIEEITAINAPGQLKA